MSFDWKSVVKQAAPLLGTALGGPLGLAAGKLVAVALGGDETKATSEDLSKLVQTVTPEQLLALKNAEAEWAFKLKELNIKSVQELEALAVQDRDSARQREIAVQDWTPRILAYIIAFGFLGMAFGVLFKGMKVESALAGSIIGYLSAKAELVYAYYFGSSAGSARKDALLSERK